MTQEVYLVDAKRSPQVRAGLDLKDIAAPYLGHYLIRQLVSEHQIPADHVDEVIIGNTGTPAKYPNVGRVLALEAGLDKKTSAYTVHRNCASGMEALSQAYDKIKVGRSHLVFAGGVESMSQMPLLFNEKMTNFFIKLMKARKPADRLKIFTEFRLPYLSPVIAIEQGLTDPFCGLNMGQTAELLARELGISREEQDEFANHSHHKANKSIAEGLFDDEVVPIIYGKELNKLLTKDLGPRPDSSMEKLAKLRPYFEKNTGTVTVGNSCPITDGGSVCLLASEQALKEHNLEPMAKIVDYHFHGLEPERMGMGPLLASNGLLKRTGVKVDDLDLIEINEAFAAQTIAVLKAFKESKISKKWGIDEAPGEIDPVKLNVNGGAIALGHPVGSTGSRLVTTLAHQLKREKKKFGLATLCIGGGQGGAMLIENLQCS
jgi:acetyl-CoA C-acetyltransferase/acetyl-CoA acyltransferase